jgi:hypothetical protein
MTAQRMEWLSWKDRIMAKADPMETTAVAALSLAIVGSFEGSG